MDNATTSSSSSSISAITVSRSTFRCTRFNINYQALKVKLDYYYLLRLPNIRRKWLFRHHWQCRALFPVVATLPVGAWSAHDSSCSYLAIAFESQPRLWTAFRLWPKMSKAWMLVMFKWTKSDKTMQINIKDTSRNCMADGTGSAARHSPVPVPTPMIISSLIEIW